MRQRLIPFIVPAIGACLLIAWGSAGRPAAPRAERPAPRCFLSSQVNGFTPRGQDAVDVHVGANRDYRLTLAGVCPDVDWSFRVGLRTTGGSSWICEGGDAEIIVPSPNGRQRCLVSAIRPLSAAEVAATRHRGH
jgi:hypothetical protein